MLNNYAFDPIMSYPFNPNLFNPPPPPPPVPIVPIVPIVEDDEIVSDFILSSREIAFIDPITKWRTVLKFRRKEEMLSSEIEEIERRLIDLGHDPNTVLWKRFTESKEEPPPLARPPCPANGDELIVKNWHLGEEVENARIEKGKAIDSMNQERERADSAEARIKSQKEMYEGQINNMEALHVIDLEHLNTNRDKDVAKVERQRDQVIKENERLKLEIEELKARAIPAPVEHSSMDQNSDSSACATPEPILDAPTPAPTNSEFQAKWNKAVAFAENEEREFTEMKRYPRFFFNAEGPRVLPQHVDQVLSTKAFYLSDVTIKNKSWKNLVKNRPREQARLLNLSSRCKRHQNKQIEQGMIALKPESVRGGGKKKAPSYEEVMGSHAQKMAKLSHTSTD